MKQLPAPDRILKMIFCGCRTGCGRACGYRRVGLQCTELCTNCWNQGCLNIPICPDVYEDEPIELNEDQQINKYE